MDLRRPEVKLRILSCQRLRGLCALIAFRSLRVSIASSEDVLIKDVAIRDKQCANGRFLPCFTKNEIGTLLANAGSDVPQVFHTEAWALSQTSLCFLSY